MESLNKSGQSEKEIVRYVHRDIKPENVLIDGNYNTFLSDFGSAEKISQDSTDSEIGTTPGYQSPEMFAWINFG